MEVEKTFNDDDVLLMQKQLAAVDQDELFKIFNIYVQNINAVIAIAKEQAKQDDDEEDILALLQVSRILGVAPPDEIFIRSHQKIWVNREQILNKNIDFFLNRNYSHLIKQDRHQTFLTTLINIIKHKFAKLDKDVQNLYWNKIFCLLQCIIKYKKLVAEYNL